MRKIQGYLIAVFLLITFFVCFTVRAGNIEQNAVKEIGNFFDSIGQFFDDSMLIIVPNEQGHVYLVKTTDFSRNSTKVLEETKPILLDELKSELAKQGQENVTRVSHLFVVAQKEVKYDYLLRIVNTYLDSLKTFPKFNSLKFQLTLWGSFSNLNELKGSLGTEVPGTHFKKGKSGGVPGE